MEYNGPNSSRGRKSKDVQKDLNIRQLLGLKDLDINYSPSNLASSDAARPISYAHQSFLDRSNLYEPVSSSSEAPIKSDAGAVSSTKIKSLVAVVELNNIATAADVVKKTMRSRSVESNYLNQLWKEGLLIKKQAPDGKVIFSVSEKGRAVLNVIDVSQAYPKEITENPSKVSTGTAIRYRDELQQDLRSGLVSSMTNEYLALKAADITPSKFSRSLPSSPLIQHPAPFVLTLKDVTKDGMQDYHGVLLTATECAVLYSIEEFIGKPIPHLDRVEWNTFGFASEDGHVLALGLFNTGLKSLPAKIGSLKFLKWLSLADNSLTSMPDSIGQLEALEMVSVNGNKLDSLPETIVKLKALIRLDAFNNQLVSLPGKIGDLAAIVRLDVRNNKLESLPETIKHLTKLQFLLVENNPLSKLAPGLKNWVGNFSA
nr:leucine-rich repeat domain-containing protein [Candidatus Sigynarchaeota archaeon]